MNEHNVFKYDLFAAILPASVCQFAPAKGTAVTFNAISDIIEAGKLNFTLHKMLIGMRTQMN